MYVLLHFKNFHKFYPFTRRLHTISNFGNLVELNYENSYDLTHSKYLFYICTTVVDLARIVFSTTSV